MTDQEIRRQWVLTALGEFEGRLVRYAHRLLGNEDEARDVVQFVFLRLCDEHPEKIGCRLAQWLFTVCRNRAMDMLRASGRENANGQTGGWGLRSMPQHAREPDPADSAEQSDLHALLRTLVDHLPANQREAIDLWAEGFSYRDISGILQCEEGHIRVLVHRGLKTIRNDPRIAALMEETPAAPRRQKIATGVSHENCCRSAATQNPLGISPR